MTETRLETSLSWCSLVCSLAEEIPVVAYNKQETSSKIGEEEDEDDPVQALFTIRAQRCGCAQMVSTIIWCWYGLLRTLPNLIRVTMMAPSKTHCL